MNHNPLPIIDGEAAPYPRPRTLAQEVEVQRRRCRCKCGESNHYNQEATVRTWGEGLWVVVQCGRCGLRTYGHSTPLLARKRFNTFCGPYRAKATRAFDALKARLKAANEKLQRAEALFAKMCVVAAESNTLKTRVAELEVISQYLEDRYDSIADD